MNLNEMDFGEYDDEFICPICCEDLEEDDLATRYCECKFMVNIFPKFI
jgi:transcription initiation factor IIE alpha subunit